jgi:hypothetical protein
VYTHKAKKIKTRHEISPTKGSKPIDKAARKKEKKERMKQEKKLREQQKRSRAEG